MSGYKLVKHHHTGKALWLCLTSRPKAWRTKVTWPHHHQHHHQWHRFLSVRLTRAGIIDRISKPVRSDERKKSGLTFELKSIMKNFWHRLIYFLSKTRRINFSGFRHNQQLFLVLIGSRKKPFLTFSVNLEFLNSLGSFFTHLQITHSQKHRKRAYC